MLPTLALPVTDTAPLVTKLPPVMLPIAVIVLDELIARFATKLLDVTVPLKFAFVTLAMLAGRSTHSSWADWVITADWYPFASLPILSVLVRTCKQAIFALMTTLPVVGYATMPAPGVWLTERTA